MGKFRHTEIFDSLMVMFDAGNANEGALVIGCSLDGLDIRRVIMLLSMCNIEASRLVLKEVQLGISATNR